MHETGATPWSRIPQPHRGGMHDVTYHHHPPSPNGAASTRPGQRPGHVSPPFAQPQRGGMHETGATPWSRIPQPQRGGMHVVAYHNHSPSPNGVACMRPGQRPGRVSPSPNGVACMMSRITTIPLAPTGRHPLDRGSALVTYHHHSPSPNGAACMMSCVTIIPPAPTGRHA